MGFELKLLQINAKQKQSSDSFNFQNSSNNFNSENNEFDNNNENNKFSEFIIDPNNKDLQTQGQFLENFQNKYNQRINELEMNNILKRFLKKLIVSITKGCEPNDENIAIFFEIRKFLNQKLQKQKKEQNTLAYEDFLSFLDELYLIIVDCQFSQQFTNLNYTQQNGQNNQNNENQQQQPQLDTDEGVRPNQPRNTSMSLYLNRLLQRHLVIRMLTTLNQSQSEDN